MTDRYRLTVVLTHPVQYFAPWFRHITQTCDAIDLTVLYAAAPSEVQQGVGFNTPFAWDRDLLEGYRASFLNGRGHRFDSETFLGVDARGVGEAIAATRPDAVLVTGWHSIVQVRALMACRRLGVPVLYRGDSTLDSGRPRMAVIRRARARLMLRMFSAYLSVGTRSREYLRAYGVVEPLIVDAPHAVDNAFFAGIADGVRNSNGRAEARAEVGVGDRDFLLLFAGKLTDRKRPLDVIRAAAQLGTDVAVMIAGGGPLESACRAEAERLGVRTIWVGVLGQADLARAYATADCLVLPSEVETWGLVVNEALASGTPCVVSDKVGAAPDLIAAGETGETYPVGDVNALASAIARVRTALQSGAPVAAACRARVARHSFGVTTMGLLKGLRRVRFHRPAQDAQQGQPRVIALCGGMVIVSGVERMTFEILRGVREAGGKAHCVVNRWESSRIVDRVEDIRAEWSTGYYWYPITRRFNPRAWARSAWDTWMTSAGLLRDAWAFRPTHVLAPDFTAILRNVPALALLRLFGIPVVLRLGNPPEPGTFYRVLWRHLMNPLVDRFITNSDYTRTELLAHGVAPDKCRTILNTVPSRTGGVATELLARDSCRVIYVGQVIPPKGVLTLLDAVALLVTRGRDVQLDIVGAMDTWEPESYEGYRARVRERATAPDLRDHVRLLGEREDVPALMAQAAIHCCPSLPEQREGFGLVTAEAKHAGIPSVVFPTGALPELVTHGVDGWVSRDVTADALAEGLEYFLSSVERCREAGEHARRSAARFSRDRFVTEWLEVFGAPATAALRGAKECV